MMLLTNNVTFNGSQVCVFGSHQSMVIGTKLYVDGGTFIPKGGFNDIGYRDIRIYDLSKISVVQINGQSVSVPQMTTVTRPSSISNVRNGYLWTDPTERFLYRYGGNWIDPPDAIARVNQDSARSALVALDTDASDLGNADAWYLPPNAFPPTITRLAYGAGARSVSDYTGYYLGGFDDLSGNNHQNVNTELASIRDNLVTWDGTNNSWTNATVTTTASSPNPYNPGAAGVLLHVPIGPKGMLVSIGGHQFEGDSPNFPMDTIRVFNINDSKWYQQASIGDIPTPRAYFCGVMSAAPDNSSFNIYISGGLTQGQGVDDVYILSLPAFRWVRAFSGSGAPRLGHTCEIVQNKQMAVIGGYNATSSPTQQCALAMGGDLKFFDMSNLTFTDYQSTPAPYTVPQPVFQAIGGAANGGATARQPVAGWTDPLFQAAFSGALANTPIANTPAVPGSASTAVPSTSGVQSHPPRIAVIAGAIGGGTVFMSLFLALLILLYRRAKNPKRGRHQEIRLITEKDLKPSMSISSPSTAGGISPSADEKISYDYQPRPSQSPSFETYPPRDHYYPASPPPTFSYMERRHSPAELPAFAQKSVFAGGDVPIPSPLRLQKRTGSVSDADIVPRPLEIHSAADRANANAGAGYGANYGRTRSPPTQMPMEYGARRPQQAREIHELPSRRTAGSEKDGMAFF